MGVRVTLPETFSELQASEGVMVYLPRLRPRATHSLARLREAGFENVVVSEGVDASSLDARAVAEAEGWYFDPGLAPSEIGCSLAMIRLWSRVAEEDLPYLLVFEDDVLPHPDVNTLGPRYWAETPVDAELVLMGNHMWAPDVAALPDPARLVVDLPASCLHAYVITQAGARRALELLAADLAGDRWLAIVDMEIHRWIARHDIRAACWNGTMLDRRYPLADEVSEGMEVPSDVIRSSCATTGVFWQNEGSSFRTQRPPPPRTARRGVHRSRALLLSAFAPSRSGNGSAIRAGVALEALAESYDVDFVLAPVYGHPNVDEWATRLMHDMLVLPEAVADPFLGRVQLMVSEGEEQRARLAYPLPVHAVFSTPDAASEIVRFSGGDVDLVYAFRLFLAPLLEPWLATGSARPCVVLDADEDDWAATRQIAGLSRLSGDEEAAQLAEADAEKLLAMADAWIPRADLVFAAAPQEVARLRARYPDVAVNLLPNPAPPTGEEGQAPDVDVLFVGNFSYPPNVDAARWLCRSVLPLLRSEVGRPVSVAIVGSNVDPSVFDVEADLDVTLVVDAPSVTPWYRATKLAVAPLRAGGGTRLKILEAFTHRRPVVSTSLGAEGLPVEDGVHLLLADTAEELARACARVLRDPALRAALVDAAVPVAIAHARHRVVDDLATALADPVSSIQCAHG